jgi:HSP20 family molecular chaperone IbpA
MGANELEKFTVEVINRKDIHGADYNPRKITEAAKKKLRKFLKENGLWSPLVLNKRTMTLVSGHQRLSAMDSLLRKADYDLTMSVVDVDEKTEVSGNVFMNNPSAQGEWDVLALKDLGEIFPDIDFEADMGFDPSDIEVMFGKQEKEIEAQIEREKAEEFTTDTFREAKKKSREKAKAENQEGGSYNLADSDYTISIVFPNNHEKHAFMRKIHKPERETMLKSTVLYDIASGKLDISVFAERE